MIKYIEKYPALSLLAFVLTMFMFTIEAIPVTIMEARNFISAREMLTDNNWILTTMNAEPRYQKPPLPTWITALFGSVFGINSLTALRLPGFLCLSFIGYIVYKFSCKLEYNKSESLISGFVAVTSFYVFGIVIEAPWDIYSHTFMLLGIYALFNMLKQQKINFKYGFILLIGIAASILSKGPVSLYVLFLSFVISYGLSFSFKGKLLFFLKLISLLIFGITIGAWWFIYVKIADPETFLKITSKETSNWSSYNVRPFYYYWSFFVQSGIWSIFALVSLCYPYLKPKVKLPKVYKFSFWWTIIAVILLSIIPEKKSRYLMPVLIPLALNIGCYINYFIKNWNTIKLKKERLPIFFQFGAITLVCFISVGLYFFIDFSLIKYSLLRYIFLTIVLCALGVLIIKQLKNQHLKPVFYLSISVLLTIGLFGIPLIKLTYIENYKPLKSKHNIIDSNNTYYIGQVSPEAIFLFGNKINKLQNEEGIILPKNDFYLITDKEKNDQFEILKQYYNIEFKDFYDLNTVNKNQRGYRSRLYNELYFLSRK